MAELQNPGRTEQRTPGGVRKSSTLSLQNLPIVWAMDAFPDHADLQMRTSVILQKLFPLSPIYPVYVLSEESFTDHAVRSNMRASLKPLASSALSALLADVRFLDLKKPRVLIESSASRPTCAKRLLRFAERIGAGLIAISSHGRKGISKFIVGSFSEAVLDHARLPVLINGPKTLQPSRKPSAILFPTDFSESCRLAYPKVLELCQRFGAELHIFHKVVHPMDPIVQSGVHMLGGGWVSVEAYFNQPANDHHEDAEAWIRQAESFGVRARFAPENFREPISEAIVEYENKFSSASPLIVMVSQAGPFASALFGSVTREVIRLSSCPVYLVPRTDTGTKPR